LFSMQWPLLSHRSILIVTGFARASSSLSGQHSEEQCASYRSPTTDCHRVSLFVDCEISILVIRLSCEGTSRGDHHEGRQIPDPSGLYRAEPGPKESHAPTLREPYPCPPRP